jgi:hypothetical protein
MAERFEDLQVWRKAKGLTVSVTGSRVREHSRRTSDYVIRFVVQPCR